MFIWCIVQTNKHGTMATMIIWENDMNISNHFTYIPFNHIHTHTPPDRLNCNNIVFISFLFQSIIYFVAVVVVVFLRIISLRFDGDFEGLGFHIFSSLDTWEMMMANTFYIMSYYYKRPSFMLLKQEEKTKTVSDDFGYI